MTTMTQTRKKLYDVQKICTFWMDYVSRSIWCSRVTTTDVIFTPLAAVTNHVNAFVKKL